jgi:CHAT domain-containing protein
MSVFGKRALRSPRRWQRAIAAAAASAALAVLSPALAQPGKAPAPPAGAPAGAPAKTGKAAAKAPATPELKEAERLTKEIERLADDGQFDDAIPLAEKALALREAALGKEHHLTAISESNLGALYVAKGDYVKSEPLLRHAVETLKKSQELHFIDYASALNNLAILLTNKNERGRAQALLEEAVFVHEKYGRPDNPELGVQLRALGRHHYSFARFEQARKLFERALTIHEKARLDKEILRDLVALGFLYRSQGKYYQCAENLNRAITIADKILGPRHPDRADMSLALALAYRGDRQFDRAEKLFAEVVDIYKEKKGKVHPRVADVLRHWSLLAERKRDIALALKLRAEANAIEEHYLDILLAGGTANEKETYARGLYRTTEETVSLHMWSAVNDKAAAELALTTILRRKGRVLDAMSGGLATIRKSMGEEERKLLDELSAVRGDLAKLALSGPRRGQAAEYAAEIDRLYQRELELERAVSAKSAAYRATSRDLSISAIQQAIPEGAALVEVIRYRASNLNMYSDLSPPGLPYYAAYMLRRTGPLQFARLGSSAEIVDTVVGQVRHAFAKGLKSFPDPAYRLDNMIVRPIVDQLGTTTRIFISPDGSLNLIPFAALVDENGQFRIHKYSFSYLTSGRDLLRFQAPAASRQPPLVIANPSYNRGVASAGGAAQPAAPSQESRAADAASGGDPRRARKRPATFDRVRFPDLPGTKDEAKAIQALIPGATTLLGDEATEAALKSVRGPRILHIATHGFFFDENTIALGQGQRALELVNEPPPLPGASPPAPAPAAPPPLPGDPAPLPSDQPSPNVRSTALRKIGADPLLRSGLALAGANARESGDDDGVLTALEALGLDLDGTKLVVLSACETGVGAVEQSEGIYGLRRALVVAGAETQVMSLWKVDDNATRDLMTAYYGKLLRAGAGRSEGMRGVQLAALSDKARQHPYFWAGFIVSGVEEPIAPPAPEPPSAPAPPVKAQPGVTPVAPGPRGCGCEVKSSGEGALPILAALPLFVVRARRRARRQARSRAGDQ